MIGEIYILLGSNIGNRQEYLKRAINLIEQENIRLINLSSVYETKAWGITDQPAFLNMIAEIHTHYEPSRLLQILQRVEKLIGKKKEIKWGPRNIDIDILYFRNIQHSTKELTIPHPEIQNRRFTLVPMNELNEGFIHPKLLRTQKELLQECTDMSEVNRLTKNLKSL